MKTYSMSENGKAVVNMTGWSLYVYNEHYSLSGTADNHPRLGKNTYVGSTSSMVAYKYEDDILTYETMNTIYMCPLKYMSIHPYGNVVTEYKVELAKRTEKYDTILDKLIEVAARLSLLWDFENPEYCTWQELKDGDNIITAESLKNDFLLYVIKLQEQGQQEIEAYNDAVNAGLIEKALKYDDCIYIEMSDVLNGSRLAYHLGKYTGVVDSYVHSGMFQDSVLYTKYEYEDDGCALDFRYFPKGNGDVIETYSWSDNIMQAVIMNDCSYAFTFNGTTLKPGETKIFTPNTHKQGLISPDCYNGKSLFWGMPEENEEEE